jgi:hypothetical protein
MIIVVENYFAKEACIFIESGYWGGQKRLLAFFQKSLLDASHL